jgi:outer membrane receptor protein involved in Fe transport
MIKSYKFLIILLFAATSSICSIAQKGTIRGTVFDDGNGEPLIGVTVQVKGGNTGGITDFDGKFSISLAAGNNDLQISYVSYQAVVISGVVVKENEVTIIDNIRLKEDVLSLEAVVVTAEVMKNSEAAILTVKRKSPNLVDGISAAKFRQTGDSDASDAVKRVTGVSVEGGKYVFVRGLGDRYTKTTLNSVDIPGLDPDRNSIQIDIFPTSLIENMLVLKSSVAEMPADFTGGVVNIETKDFPEEKVFNVSASVGYNPNMHFNKNFFSYQGGGTDWLGYDDGTRKLPSEATQVPFPTLGAPGVNDQQINSFLKKFDKNLGAQTQTSFMDYSLGLTFGNQKNFKNGNTLGYVFSTTYKNSTVFYDKAFFGEYQRPAFPDEFELVYATTQTGAISEKNVLIGGLGGLAYKTQKSKFKLNILHLQSGEKKAAQFFIDDNGTAVGKSGFFGSSDNLEYSQRGVTNFLLNGEHYNKDRSFSIDWRVSPTISKIVEPDIRKTAFTYTSSDTVFSTGAAGNPTRIWRYLDEVNLVAKVDVKRDYLLLGQPNTLKFGASLTLKERDFSILSYDLVFNGTQPEFNGEPQNVLNDQFLYPNGQAYFSSANPNPNPNSYNSTINNQALYISNQFKFFSKLTSIIGLRGEKYVQRHTGRDATFANGDVINGKKLDDAIVLDAFDLFPSANIIYAVTDNQNFRFSYSRTIARPSFKELSFAQILDPVSNRIFNGGLFKYSDWDGNLRETRIDNFDLRWELFMKQGELLSLSTFYKTFDKPIELVRIPEAQTTNEFQPRNVGNGTILGLEIEFKKSLNILSESLRHFYLSGNVTLVKSTIDITEREFNARKLYEKNGQTVSKTREMAGQAPYIINVGFSYENPKMGLDGGLFYNVNGPTLTVVGGGLFPDVFSQPFNSLNFTINKALGKSRKSNFTFNVSNILNEVRANFFQGFNAQKQYYSSLNPGTSINIGFKFGI